MIRHGNVVRGLGRWVVSQAIESLTIAMVKPAFGTLLVAAVSLAPLLSSGLLPASLAAVSVTTVAMRADEKQRSALIGPTKPLTQYAVTSISHRSGERRSTAGARCGKIAAFSGSLLRLRGCTTNPGC